MRVYLGLTSVFPGNNMHIDTITVDHVYFFSATSLNNNLINVGLLCFTRGENGKENDDCYSYNHESPIGESAQNPVEGVERKIGVCEKEPSATGNKQYQPNNHEKYTHSAAPNISVVCPDITILQYEGLDTKIKRNVIGTLCRELNNKTTLA